MQHFTAALTRSTPVRTELLSTALHTLIHRHGEAFYDAAAALGGPRGARLVPKLEAQLHEATAVTRSAERLAGELLALLSLEGVDDLDGEDAGFFAQIDPASDLVHEICRLTDLLQEALASIEGFRSQM
ncbi:hypothetical protein FIU97_19365 (plasmid) [Roseivivax sp. THAF40]|uniref:hypothetical protein n=1 Tax=unclassified Roseivivax TaxID=2639302 RepID=UPI00126982C4|nr:MULTISPECIES: hypothetical protein [unclassified Roseivivax]QFS84853.1 hypothetical protein FIV09_18580 [Roseivivax sp. THAF197b]QFT48755.1 hypothetical protein FIU97_19365 [Roseivivax sp. THAF40]